LKALKHILSILIWTIVGLHVALFALLKFPAVQDIIGSRVASVLARKLGTRVAVGNVNVGLFDRVVVDDIAIFDQSHKPMLMTKRASAKINLADLAQGKITISSAQLIGVRLTLCQVSPTAKPNYQFALDSLASRDTVKKETTLNLRVRSFIMHHAHITYDKLYEPETPRRFNTSHIGLNDMGANIILERLTGDSINVNVKKLTAKEKSGFDLRKLSFRLAMGKHATQLSDFKLTLPNTALQLGETTATYIIDNKRLLKSSLKLSSSITPSTITPSDFASFYNKLSQFDHKIRLRADISGANARLNIGNLDLSTTDNNINILMAGWIAQRGGSHEWRADIKRMDVTASAIADTWQLLANDKAPLPPIVERLGDISLKGNAQGSPTNDMAADCELKTKVGELMAKAAIDGNRHFTAKVDGHDIDLGALLNTDQLGSLSATAEANGEVPSKERLSLQAAINVSSFQAKGHTYEGIALEGQYSADGVGATLQIDDPSLRLSADGSYRKEGAKNIVALTACIRDFEPYALNLTNKWKQKKINLDLAADMSGNADGGKPMRGKASIGLNDITLVTPDTTYHAGSISAQLDNAVETPRINVASDFANLSLEGNFDLKTLVASYTNVLSKVIPSMPGLPHYNERANNDFVFTADVSDAEIFNQLFGSKLNIQRPLKLTTKMKDRNDKAYLHLDAPAFAYDGSKYEGVSLDITQPDPLTIACKASATKLMDNGERLSAKLDGEASNNKLKTSLSLANDTETFSGVLNTAASFFLDDHHRQTAQVEIDRSQLNVNGQAWELLPAVVRYSKSNLEVSGFSITDGRNYVAINGKSSVSPDDSLMVKLQGIDVAYVLNLVNFHAVDFGGAASGQVYAKALFSPNPQMYGKLNVKDFTFQDGGMGTLIADVNWNNPKGLIEVDAVADDGPNSRTLINGYISPVHNNIDLAFDAQNTRLDFLMSFTHAFLSRLDGTANGKMRLVGPLSAMDLQGKVAVEGTAHVKVLGCDYTLRGDSVDFVHNEIQFKGTRIYDRDGNVGYVYGGLHHENLRRMTYDLDVRADNLLSYDFDDFYGQSFYATVYASGDVKIHGVPGLLKIDVNATPQRGTTFVYNVSNPDAVANQKFILWNDAANRDTLSSNASKATIDDYDLPSDTRINFIVNCNQNATLKLLMDSKTNDYITLYGDGVINADYYNNGTFKMTGTYKVDHGTYGITIQNIIKKNFVFNPGGTIIFGGNPFDAALNLEAVYTVNGVSLSDLNIGSSFKSNTIKVNCLMNIGGIAQRPSVTFDLDLPTLGTDEKQMVKSVINGEEEMNQQVVYLLGIGRFYPQGNNNSTARGDNQPDQTSLAMQSLLSGTISSQISQLLNTVVNNNNWNFGANISTGDEGWNNAEYEGLLSGQLLNNRLLINGQFGYRDSKNTATTSFIGDFDIKYLLTPNGNFALKAYNQTNDRYFTKSSLNTQGIGFILKKDFGNIGELFRFGKKKKGEK